MAIIRIPTDQPDIAAALTAASPGDTLQFEVGLGQADFVVTVNNLILEAAQGEDFVATLGPGVTQVTTSGAGTVEIIGNNDGNTITSGSSSGTFDEITLGTGNDIVFGGRGADVIQVGAGTKAIDLGLFADIGQINDDGGAVNESDTDFIIGQTRGTSHVTITNFSLQENQNLGQTDDRLIFSGTTRADFAANADFFVGKVAGSPASWQGLVAPALASLGGYTDTPDWEVSIAFDYDGNGTYDSIYTLHDVFDGDQQTQIKTVLTNTNFAVADAGGLVQIDAADEANFISGTLNPLGNDNVGFVLFVDPSRNAANDGQLDGTSGAIAFSTITAALAAAGEGDVLLLAPGDHTFGGTVANIALNVQNITLEAAAPGPMILPSVTLGAAVREVQSRLEAGVLNVTGSATGTTYSLSETSDTVVGGNGNDVFGSLGGVDLFNGNGGDDTASVFLSQGSTLTFDGGEIGETEGDTLNAVDQSGLDRSFVVSAGAPGVTIESTGRGPAEVTASNIEKLVVSSTGGNDTFTLTGDFGAAGILQANVVTFALTTTIIGGNGTNVFDASGVTSTTGIAFVGGSGNDTYTGSIGADLLLDQAGGINSFTGGVGDDQIFATGGGANTAHYVLSADNYVVTASAIPGRFLVRAVNGNEGTDTLTGITQLSFNNGAQAGAIADFVSSGRSDFGFGSADDLLFDFGGGHLLTQTVAVPQGFPGTSFTFGGVRNDRTVRLAGDFDGDGDADLLAELNAGGAYVVVDPTSDNVFIGQADRTAKAAGDFDGDGADEILFTLDAGGHHVIGNVGAPNVFLGRTDRSVQATGDFDGDGDDDILMKLTAGGAHVIEKIGEANVFIGGADRTARAVGDFDGDNDDDILMEINATGNYVIEKVGEANVFLGRSDRTVRGVGDFDGDGDDDILFQLDAGNHYLIEKIGQANVFLGGADRTVRAIGDFDGDGDDDILMELNANGLHVIENVGEANQFLGLGDRDAVDLGLNELGLAFDLI